MTAPVYISCGKQVLRDVGHGPGHFADMVCNAHAEALVVLLNKGVMFTSEASEAEAELVRSALWA